MKLDVIRYSDNGESTLGLLYIDGKFQCYTIEDEYREVKVRGETRVPCGEYVIGYRKEGGHHDKYSRKFPEFHKGMLHVLDVPNFNYILIHIGNTDEDTEGCLLVGNTVNNNNIADGRVTDSTGAYENMYKIVSNALESGEKVTIQYHDN